MKPRLYKIPKLSNHPIATQYDYSEKRYGKYHFHEEIQVTYIKKGTGILLCGTGSTRFSHNNLFIIGKGVPHVFIGHENELIESISIYFKPNWLKNIYPDSNYFDHFLRISESGVKIKDWKHENLIEDTLNKGGLYRVSSFILFLEKLSEINASKELISAKTNLSATKYSDSEKLDDVFKFISKNIEKQIKLNQLAEITNLTPQSFCRYFKQKSGKTVGNYIAELRVELACKLLQNEDLTVDMICYKVGYNNFSNFVRQFKKIKNTTPKQFREENYRTRTIKF